MVCQKAFREDEMISKVSNGKYKPCILQQGVASCQKEQYG